MKLAQCPYNGQIIREKLEAGFLVTCRPRGNSMTPRIQSGQLVWIVPFDGQVEKGDVVFCKVSGRYYLHLVTAVRNKTVQISNNHGHVNGWTSMNQVFGKLIRVE